MPVTVRAPTRREIGQSAVKIRIDAPYLDQLLVPLAVALPQMVEQIEAELVGEKLAGADQRRLRQRVELIRWLLTPAR